MCERADLDAEGKAKELGALMDASHASCSKQYECSAPELEQLVEAAKVRLFAGGWAL